MIKKSKSRVLDDAFWSKFSRVYWERKPVALKRVASPILEIDAAQIFKLLVLYSDHCRKTNAVDGLKFYIAGQPQYVNEILEYLPVCEDVSLAGYHKRMKKLFPDYCLVCDELMQVFIEKWDVLGTFMRGLYKHIGIPNKYSEIGLYLGSYRKTPFGVHVDGCGVLSIPVAGTKRFRLWTPDYVEAHPELKDAHRYPGYLKESTLLVAKPGDITYWPSSYWHIAESDGAFSATWSIGMWVDQPHSDLLIGMIRPLLAKMLGSDADLHSIKFQKRHGRHGGAEKLPAILGRSIKVLQNFPKAELQDLLLRFWLEFSSKTGFKNAPVAHAKTKLVSGDHVRGKPDNPILWTTFSDGRLCLAANGMIIGAPKSVGLIKLVQKLNSGQLCEISKFMAHLKTLQSIYNAHGLVKLP